MKNVNIFIHPKSLRRRVNREFLKVIASEFGGYITFQEESILVNKGFSRGYLRGVVILRVSRDFERSVKKLLRMFGIKFVSRGKAVGIYPRKIVLHLLSRTNYNTPIGFGQNMDRLVLIKLPSFIQTDSFEFALYISYLSNSVIWFGESLPSRDFKLIDSISIRGVDEGKLFNLATFIAKHTIGLNRRVDILEQLKKDVDLLGDEEMVVLPEEGKALNIFFSKGLFTRDRKQGLSGKFFFEISNLPTFISNSLALASNLIGFKTTVFEGQIYGELTELLDKNGTFIHITDEDNLAKGFDFLVNLRKRVLVYRIGGDFLSEKFTPIWEVFGGLR